MADRITITTSSFAEFDKRPLAVLKDAGYEVILNPYARRLKTEEIAALCGGSVGIVAGVESITAKVLESLKGLRVISRCGTGIENVDVNAAKKLSIKVYNTPDAPTSAVAELTVGLILDLLRNISTMNGKLKSGRWERSMGNLLAGKKVGILGFGRIGRKVAELLKPFGCEVIFSDPAVKGGPSKEDVICRADIITIHAATGEKILTAKEISRVKKGAWIINTSRGENIDEMALYDLIKSGHIRGAALDVFEKEPYSGPLKELDNVILTPHAGSYTAESRVKMEMEAVENLIKGLKEKT